VVEGWYGSRTRARCSARGSTSTSCAPSSPGRPVTYDGRHYQLPLPGGTGLGKPLRSILHPYRAQIPIYLGAEGPKNVALAAEIADGWLPMFFSPAMNGFYAAALASGFARPGARRTPETFDVVGGPLGIVPTTTSSGRPTGCGPRWPSTSVAWAPATSTSTPRSSLAWATSGGEGHPGCLPVRRQEGRHRRGPHSPGRRRRPHRPWAKIADELSRWTQTVLTTLVISCDPRVLEKVADLARAA